MNEKEIIDEALRDARKSLEGAKESVKYLEFLCANAHKRIEFLSGLIDRLESLDD